MAYRKTEKIIADMEARKTAIIDATLFLVGRHGIAGATTAMIAKRAKVSEGVIFKYFPDKTELFAAAFGEMLVYDLEVLREHASLPDALQAWLRSLTDERKTMMLVGTVPAYREGIKAELLRKLRDAGAEMPSVSCAVVYGAMIEAARHLTPREERPLLAALMRACGLRVRVAA